MDALAEFIRCIEFLLIFLLNLVHSTHNTHTFITL